MKQIFLFHLKYNEQEKTRMTYKKQRIKSVWTERRIRLKQITIIPDNKMKTNINKQIKMTMRQNGSRAGARTVKGAGALPDDLLSYNIREPFRFSGKKPGETKNSLRTVSVFLADFS